MAPQKPIKSNCGVCTTPGFTQGLYAGYLNVASWDGRFAQMLGITGVLGIDDDINQLHDLNRDQWNQVYLPYEGQPTLLPYEGKVANASAGVGVGSAYAAVIVQINKWLGELGGNCFPAGTPVATPRGLFPIETIKPGDEVWSYDLVNGRWCPARVLETYVHDHDGESVSITVPDEAVESTPLHPFWVVRGADLASRPVRAHLPKVAEGATAQGRWVDAGDLRVGDELLLRDGRIMPVEAVERRRFHDKVYNLHVEQFECYAVGQNNVLVHNNGGSIPEGGGAGEAPAATQETVTGFRAVSPQEAEAISSTGQFGPAPSGSEVKYFFDTEQQAVDFGTRMYGEGNFKVVQGDFPASAIGDRIHPATEGPAFVVPNSNLPQGTPSSPR